MEAPIMLKGLESTFFDLKCSYNSKLIKSAQQYRHISLVFTYCRSPKQFNNLQCLIQLSSPHSPMRFLRTFVSPKIDIVGAAALLNSAPE